LFLGNGGKTEKLSQYFHPAYFTVDVVLLEGSVYLELVSNKIAMILTTHVMNLLVKMTF